MKNFNIALSHLDESTMTALVQRFTGPPASENLISPEHRWQIGLSLTIPTCAGMTGGDIWDSH
jgi:hypothetical protein